MLQNTYVLVLEILGEKRKIIYWCNFHKRKILQEDKEKFHTGEFMKKVLLATYPRDKSISI